MIYKNPKTVIERYLHVSSGKKLSELELFNKLTENVSHRADLKQSNAEKIENEYVAEFIRRKLKISKNRGKIIKKIDSLITPHQFLNKNDVNSNTEEVQSSLKTDTSSFPRIKSAKRVRFFRDQHKNESSNSTDKNSLLAKHKIRIIPKNKGAAMSDYYKINVKNLHSPSPNAQQKVLLALRSFSCERLKTFKDFQIVKLFK